MSLRELWSPLLADTFQVALSLRTSAVAEEVVAIVRGVCGICSEVFELEDFVFIAVFFTRAFFGAIEVVDASVVDEVAVAVARLNCLTTSTEYFVAWLDA